MANTRRKSSNSALERAESLLEDATPESKAKTAATLAMEFSSAP